MQVRLQTEVYYFNKLIAEYAPPDMMERFEDE
jgi:hypothetical protein